MASNGSATHGQGCGVVGLLLTDRDAELVPEVFSRLNEALQHVDVPVDLLVSLRDRDAKANAACEKYRPSKVRNIKYLPAAYEAEFAGNYHTSAVLNAICDQRNAVREEALKGKYDWLFFLDSDIFINPDTLKLLLATKKQCIGAVYQPRWSSHVVVGVNQGDESKGECSLQLLINPHLLKFDPPRDALPCSVLGFGAMVIRSPLLNVQYKVDESIGGVKGEDIGFCIELLASKDVERFPHFLVGHHVKHVSGGARKRNFVPVLRDDVPLLTHVQRSQLHWVEVDIPIDWQCVEPVEGKSFLESIPDKYRESYEAAYSGDFASPRKPPKHGNEHRSRLGSDTGFRGRQSTHLTVQTASAAGLRSAEPTPPCSPFLADLGDEADRRSDRSLDDEDDAGGARGSELSSPMDEEKHVADDSAVKDFSVSMAPVQGEAYNALHGYFSVSDPNSHTLPIHTTKPRNSHPILVEIITKPLPSWRILHHEIAKTTPKMVNI